MDEETYEAAKADAERIALLRLAEAIERLNWTILALYASSIILFLLGWYVDANNLLTKLVGG